MVNKRKLTALGKAKAEIAGLVARDADREADLLKLSELAATQTAALKRLTVAHEKLATQCFMTIGRLARIEGDTKDGYSSKHLTHLVSLIRGELETVANETRPAHWPVTDGAAMTCGEGESTFDAFLSLHTVEESGASITVRQLWDEYCRWMKANCYLPLSQTTFSRLAALRFPRIEGRMRGFAGVRFKTPEELAADEAELPF